MKANLLYRGQDFDFGAELPPNHEDVVQDLELTTVLQAMAFGDKYLFEVASRVVLTSLNDPAAIVYRQQVLADCIAKPEIIREMYALTIEAIEDRRGIWGYSSRLPSTVLSGAVSQLEAFVSSLRRLREIADRHAEEFQSGGMTALFQTVQHELDDDYFEKIGHHLKQLRFRDGVLLSVELGRDNSGTGYVLRSPGSAKPSWKERIGFGPHSSYSFTISPRDEAGADALSEMKGRGINLVANALAQSTDHIQSYFNMLRAELGFYVGCLNLHDRLVAKGEPTCFPVPSAWSAVELSFSGLCDVSLALRTETRVVGNAINADGKTLVVVTGANSGGKSTFLRSVGLTQLMMQCGMFVVAESCRASVYDGIFTHFIREEDATMTSGRLDEELSRMNAIADQITSHSLVIFNESFAATNEREGSEIARQVVRALQEVGVRVFFVTHQFDLAEGFHTQRLDTALFLQAERQPDGRRSYRLIEGQPQSTSYGEDLYRKVFEPGPSAEIEDQAWRSSGAGVGEDASAR